MKFQWEVFVIVALLAVDSQETCSGPSKTFSLSKGDLEDPSRFLDEVRSWVDEVTNKPTTSTPEVSTTTTEISNTLSSGTASGNATLTGSYASTSTDTTTATQSEVETTTDSTTTTSVNAVESCSTSSHVSNSEGGATATPSQEDATHSTVTNILPTSLTESYTTTTTNPLTTITSKMDTITTNILASSERDTTTNAGTPPSYLSQNTTNSELILDIPEICEDTLCYWSVLSVNKDINYAAAEKICQDNDGSVPFTINENVRTCMVKNIRQKITKKPIWVWTSTTVQFSDCSFGHYSSTDNNRVSRGASKRSVMRINDDGYDMECTESTFPAHGAICQSLNWNSK